MSDPMSDGPTEEQMRAYLENLREAQPVEIVVQAFGLLATASEVKLGRFDARVLIDGMAALLEATAGRMPDEIVDRMQQTVGQLQVAQVQAERDVAAAEADEVGEGGQPSAEPPTAERPTAGQQEQQQQQQSREDLTNRLWIPGRD
jgi:hypothetical protein